MNWRVSKVGLAVADGLICCSDEMVGFGWCGSLLAKFVVILVRSSVIECLILHFLYILKDEWYFKVGVSN